MGDCLHQKTYSTGTVPFRTERNHGKKPQYFIRDDHEGILSRDEQMRLQQIKEHRLGHRARMKSCGNEGAYILSGKVVCGECGRVFIRKKEQRQKGVSIKWRCPGHRSEAVSYTHLDVYKRQGETRTLRQNHCISYECDRNRIAAGNYCNSHQAGRNNL